MTKPIYHLLSIRQYSVNVCSSIALHQMKNSQKASMQMKITQELNSNPTTDVWAKKRTWAPAPHRDTRRF